MSAADFTRVIFLLNSFGLGGSERKVVRIAAHLANVGEQVGCAYMQMPATLEPTLPAQVKRWFLDRRARLSVALVRKLLRLAEHPDGVVLLAVNQYPALYAAVLRRIARRRFPRVICLMNTSTFERSRDFWFRPLYSWALQQMDVVVYGSEGQRALWDDPRNASWQRSRVLYNGVDRLRFNHPAFASAGRALRDSLGIPANRFVFGSSGRLAPEKNYLVLVEALAQLRKAGVDAQLLIVGEGPQRSALESLARDRGVVEFMSLIGQQQDVRPALAALDVFVLPSTNETFSNAALEAMSMGRPVILSRVGGAPEMVTEGVEGHLLEPEELDAALAPALGALARSPARCAELGLGAATRIASQFSEEVMLREYRQLIEQGNR
jgi:glycosyltransferase involved in cell wall biosynthesis